LRCYFCSNADSSPRALPAEAFGYLEVDGYIVIVIVFDIVIIIVEHIHAAPGDSPSFDDWTSMVDLEMEASLPGISHFFLLIGRPSATDCLAGLNLQVPASDKPATRACQPYSLLFLKPPTYTSARCLLSSAPQPSTSRSSNDPSTTCPDRFLRHPNGQEAAIQSYY
jgi:hypothetical protein